jgi:hypothetical protein
MTISIFALGLTVAGALVFALAKDKAAEMGRIAFFVGLFWLASTLLGKSLHVGSIGDLLEGTAHAQPTDPDPVVEPPVDEDPRSAPADDVVSPTDSDAPDVERIYSAVRSGQWTQVAGLVLLALVWGVRRWGGKLWPALLSDRGGVLVSAALGVAFSIGTALAAGRTPGPADIQAGLGFAAVASGTWVMANRLAKPQDRSIAPPPRG